MKLRPKRISTLQLTRNLREMFQAVQQGDTVVVEEQGRASVAIVDWIDLEILRAVIEHYLKRPSIDSEGGLPASLLDGLEGQALFDLVISRYLASCISLGRAAEALGLPWVELRSRLTRLGIPISTGPTDEEGVRHDVLVAESIAS